MVKLYSKSREKRIHHKEDKEEGPEIDRTKWLCTHPCSLLLLGFFFVDHGKEGCPTVID